ncbi:YybH family protein [Noviherbaspirillum sp.]|uniref:YybH family protein n=1 Tax=Noviherbaspirillum sp. TaxID=1926288 RepID=UPI002FE28279
MNANSSNMVAEAEIRELIAAWLKAAQTRDVEGVAAHYAPDIVAYDAVSQLRFIGVDAYKQHWTACMAMCPGPMIFEAPELNITAGDDVAFAHGLIRCGEKMEDGGEKASWMRMSTGYRKRGGKWLVVHEHFSAPFDMESGKALFELQP